MVALFEVGASTTSMQVIRNDEVLYDRDQAFGGAQLTQLIVRQYGFSPEEAEAKKRSGELPDDYEAGAAPLRGQHGAGSGPRPPVLLHQHPAQPRGPHHGGRRLGGAARPDDAITAQTSFPCVLADPFQGMQFGDNVREKKVRARRPRT